MPPSHATPPSRQRSRTEGAVRRGGEIGSHMAQALDQAGRYIDQRVRLHIQPCLTIYLAILQNRTSGRRSRDRLGG